MITYTMTDTISIKKSYRIKDAHSRYLLTTARFLLDPMQLEVY